MAATSTELCSKMILKVPKWVLFLPVLFSLFVKRNNVRSLLPIGHSKRRYNRRSCNDLKMYYVMN